MPFFPPKYFFRIGFASLLILVALLSYGRPLPAPHDILPEIARGAPTQENLSSAESRTLVVSEYAYTIVPKAAYTIDGLVVSLHKSDSFLDVTHEHDPLNTIDLCVVWGPNITTNGYRKVSYKSGDFTCFYKWTTEEDPPFSGQFLANNHLVPATGAIAAFIQDIEIGDQVRLSGKLADYTVAKDGITLGRRNTSLTREDTGNGACEIIYLTEARILKKHMPWRTTAINILGATAGIGFFGGLALALRKRPIEEPRIIAANDPSPENPLDPRNYGKKRGD